MESEKNQDLTSTCPGIELTDQEWVVAVFKCDPADVRRMLIEFYGFVKDIKGVRSLHFVIKDRLKDSVVFSFRVLVDASDRQVVQSKLNYKLGMLVHKNQFAVDPSARDPLERYVAWSPDEEISRRGLRKFNDFCNFLNRMSKLVLQMARKKYFGSDERVEVARTAAGMLGCTEYGILSAEHWEVGYYDRIDDRYCQCLKRDFSSPGHKKK